MKNLFLLLVLSITTMMSAQTSPTSKGNFVIETAVLANSSTPNTGLGYTTVENGVKTFNIGLNGGYFVADNLALKAGLGYGEARFNQTSFGKTWAYRVGAEYNIVGSFPVEVSYAKVMTRNTLYSNPQYLSTQVGYNWFVAPNVGVKPLIRYDISLTDRYVDVLSMGVGFGYYF